MQISQGFHYTKKGETPTVKTSGGIHGLKQKLTNPLEHGLVISPRLHHFNQTERNAWERYKNYKISTREITIIVRYGSVPLNIIHIGKSRIKPPFLDGDTE